MSGIIISTAEGDRVLEGEELAQFLAELPQDVLQENYRIGKSTPWRRMTDTEAVAVSAAIKQQSVREQMIYDAASYIDSGDPLFDTLKQVLVALFGEKRADELLAPETLE